MKGKEKFIICVLGILSGAGIILSALGLYFKEKEAAAISIIGGADGPTSIFIAGKINDMPVYVGTAVILLITAAYLIFRKKRKGEK